MSPQRFFDALPPYLGGKRRLCPLIFAELGRHLPQSEWHGQRLLDPMCGGGAVALYAKAVGFDVVASDVAERGAVVARALIQNSTTRLTLADLPTQWDEEGHQLPPQLRSRLGLGRASAIAAILDASLRAAEPRRSLLQLLAIRLFLKSYPLSMPSATDAPAATRGDYDAVSPRRVGHYLRTSGVPSVRELARAIDEVNGGVLPGPGSALRGDARDVLAQHPADVVFLDPPYPSTTRYDRAYVMVDALLEDDLAGLPPALDELLDAADQAPWLLLTYGGPNTSLDGLVGNVRRHRPVLSALAVPYRHLRSVASEVKNAENRELIIVAGR